MVAPSQPDRWEVDGPASWPEAPTWMSYSTLLEVESCPRRWALSSAKYPTVWSKPGYPRPLHFGALKGIVVHESLRTITSALAENGCTTIRDARAVLTLRELGGYSKIIASTLKQVLQRQEENPRVVKTLESARQLILHEVGDIRTSLQSLLSRIPQISQPRSQTASPRGPHGQTRGKLAFGSHRELELRAKHLRWLGIPDYLTLSRTVCEIRDFKTGEPKTEHEFQIKLYALLWVRDRQLNPDERLPSRLVLSYSKRDVDVPPMDEKEFCDFEDEVRERTSNVLDELRAEIPRARPQQEVCNACHVRQFCGDYWHWYGQQSSPDGSLGNRFGDVQAKVTRNNHDGTWDGVIESGLGLKEGGAVLFRTPNKADVLHENRRVRLLDVCITSPVREPGEEQDSDLRLVATVGANSEVFFLP